ncbi:MAG: hypothetical protein H6559_34150 [Lewinellaceae bacterium]|nr:hypothetical protein [Lewinellaceae bacterium]
MLYSREQVAQRYVAVGFRQGELFFLSRLFEQEVLLCGGIQRFLVLEEQQAYQPWSQ